MSRPVGHRIRCWMVAAGLTLTIGAACSESGTDVTSTPTTPAPTTSVVVAPLLPTEIDPAEALAAGCANVIGVEIEPAGDTFRVDVTVRSADTGPDKYADAWEVRALDGRVLGIRELLHDHVGEQPFTRSLTGVEIPDDVAQVVVAARDSEVGFCGLEAVAAVPRG